MEDIPIVDKLTYEELEKRIQELEQASVEQISLKHALQESQERLELALDGANLGMWDWNVQTGDVQFSESWAIILGYSPYEIQPNVSTWEALIHPEDASTVTEILEKNLEGVTSFYECEHRLRAKSGEWKWILARGKVVEWSKDGKPLRHAGTYLDVSDRVAVQTKLKDTLEKLEQRVDERTEELSKANETLKADIIKRKQMENELIESEEKFRNLSQISPVGVFVTDVEGKTIYWNDRLCEITGMSTEEGKGTGWVDGVHPDDKERVFDEWYRSAEARAIFKLEYRFVDQNGKVTWTIGQAAPMKDANNELIGFVGSITDITERKRAEEQIKTSLKEKEVLIQEIHHRVKNNMQLIISMLRLHQQYIGETDADLMEDVISRVRVFGDIHRKLYQQEDISKIDFLQHLKENLHDLIKAYNVDKKNIELELNIANPVFQLDQAVTCGLLMNELISNSLKHAFVDKGKICISIIHDTEGELEGIVYADNGTGIEAVAEGFGTKLISTLAEQLDMSVHISSKEGTRFDLVKKGMDHTIEKESGEILYVEDEVIIALDKIAYLKENGYSVNEKMITSGEQAVKYVKESNPKPSLILMDIGLKGEMNGIEAAKEIRKDNPLIPIIFLSGYEDTETQNKLTAIPNTAFLNKMSTSEEMTQLIDKHQNK